jgi:hypothetical protein
MKFKILFPHLGLAQFRPALLIDADGLPAASTASAMTSAWCHQTLLTGLEFKALASADNLQTASVVVESSDDAPPALVLVCQAGDWQHRLAIPLIGDTLMSRLNALSGGVHPPVIEVVYTSEQSNESLSLRYSVTEQQVRDLIAMSLRPINTSDPIAVWRGVGALAGKLHRSRWIQPAGGSYTVSVVVAVSWPVEVQLPVDVASQFDPGS